MSDRLLTVDDIRARLPFKIARRTLAARIRASGLAIEHRRQLALDETSWTAFLETMRCSSSGAGRMRSKARGGSGAHSGAAATTRALALIRARTQKPSSPNAPHSLCLGKHVVVGIAHAGLAVPVLGVVNHALPDLVLS